MQTIFLMRHFPHPCLFSLHFCYHDVSSKLRILRRELPLLCSSDNFDKLNGGSLALAHLTIHVCDSSEESLRSLDDRIEELRTCCLTVANGRNFVRRGRASSPERCLGIFARASVHGDVTMKPV